MAYTASNIHLQSTFSPHTTRNCVSTNTPPRLTLRPPSFTRRDCFLLTATTALTAVNLPSAFAKDIPLFGLRKKIEKAEEQAEELVKESFENVEKGIENVEKGIETAEKGVVAAEKQFESAGSFGGFAQAGVVAGAEVFGVVIATSIVNGILGSDPQKS
ncbi:uncharacterized protein LOC130807791 [Amaranthus tricolor]|uniref:uncharacterized protein LOC130807791 n=1 Tax=Amaranthus tricolor TaxID=29722 RepID=UPI002588650D|nr:uncharacterized protein LOC130807791 [Amaranthus tricolor]